VQYSICRSKKFKSVTSLFLLLSMKNNMISKIKTPLTGHQWDNFERSRGKNSGAMCKIFLTTFFPVD